MKNKGYCRENGRHPIGCIVERASLKQKVNALALGLVLADGIDEADLHENINKLKEIKQAALCLDIKDFVNDVDLAIQTLTGIKEAALTPNEGQKDLNAIFSRMEDALDWDPPDADDNTAPMPDKAAPEDQSCAPGNPDGVYHPSTLPSYLSVEDFKEFLTSKIPVLETLETLILDLENGDRNEAPKQIKRILHTMKGESGFLGLGDVEKICHRTEDLLLNAPAPEFAEVLLRVKDWFQTTFACYAQGTEPTEPVPGNCGPAAPPTKPPPGRALRLRNLFRRHLKKKRLYPG